jgi:NTE family protein
VLAPSECHDAPVSEKSGRGLVLGGGGVTGIAWETGMVAGLLEAGVDLTVADLVVGTSAGSVVGAQLAGGASVPGLYDAQITPPAPSVPPRLGARIGIGFAVALLRARGDVEAFGRRLGSWSAREAARGRTPTLEERYAAISARLGDAEWPEPGRLLVTAIDVETGALRVFDGSDGVSLRDAVAASCAVPGIYPPVPIGGRSYIDGGARSGANADLAARCERVLALAPLDRSVGPMRSVAQQLVGTPTLVVGPDETARASFGRNVLDPAARVASARAGHAQAARVVDAVREHWEAMAAS